MGAAPTTPEERTSLAKGIAGAMQVICGEDFDQCVRMQRNFESDPQSQLVFGRHEPILINRAKYHETAMATAGAV